MTRSRRRLIGGLEALAFERVALPIGAVTPPAFDRASPTLAATVTDPQNASRRNQHELAAAAERVLRAVDLDLETHSCPVRREGLAARYGDATAALPDETESPGDIFDRLTDREYDTPQEARAAVVDEIAGVDGPEGYDPERGLDLGSAGRLGTAEDPLDGERSPVDAEPRSGHDTEPEDVFDGAEPVEPEDREAGDGSAE
ncbi:hypothetical protein BRC99_00960 [Halobacteriales archaeon QS_7_69_60]|nr:MAG: hypothetical protein BRC99_00960 [Halobacteriales archaeon QS_7_69_60]